MAVLPSHGADIEPRKARGHEFAAVLSTYGEDLDLRKLRV